jgi:hypothetical protein
MSSKSKLFYGAAVVIAVAGIAGVADAKPVKTHAAAAESRTAAQIKALTEEVDALKAELDQEVAARQQAQAQAQAAQAQADQAQASVTATQSHVDDEIKRLPAEVKDDVAAAIPAKTPSWTDNTSISGRIYADVSDITNKVDGVKSNASGTSAIPAANGLGTDVKRFYVGIDHKFNDTFAMNVTTDFQYSSAVGATEVFLKKAYLQMNVSPALVVSAGANDMPWIPYAEDIYGYRFVEKTTSDRLGFGTSSDWGLHATGKLGSIFSYNVAAVNGSGYKNPSRAKSVDFEGRLSAKLDQWNFAIGGYTGKLGQEQQGVTTPQTASRFNALAAFTGDRTRFGVEYFSANDFSSALVKATTPDKADGTAVFGSYRIDPTWTVFGRAETAKLSKTINPAKKDDYYNVGLDYTAFKNVDFAFVVKHDQLVPSAGHKTVGDEVGVFSQLRY